MVRRVGNGLRVLIGGNIYGCGNLGDDAVLEGTVRLIQEAWPAARLTVATESGVRLDGLPANAGLIDRRDHVQVSDALSACDCFISGGGTMIGDELGTSFPLMHNVRHVATAKYLGKAAILLAIGANEPTTGEGRQLAEVLVRYADRITVRDAESGTVCAGLGAAEGKVTVTADPAFLLKAVETARSRDAKERIRAHARPIGVNVVNEAWTDEEGYKRCFARACDILAERAGCFPVFFCNEVRTETRYDLEANRRTAAMLKTPYTMLEPMYYTAGEMIDILSAFECVLAMRMHALIFAAVAGTPFVALSRVDKVDNFMRLFGREASGSITDCSSERLARDAESAMGERQDRRPATTKRVGELREASQRNVDVLRTEAMGLKIGRRRFAPELWPYLMKDRGRIDRCVGALLSREASLPHLLGMIMQRARRGA